jgi:hypothetical protein
MRHLNPALERLEERVAPCLGLSLPTLGIALPCQSSGGGGSGSSARSCDGTSASGERSSKSREAESCSSN